jgi:hypothetical protein
MADCMASLLSTLGALTLIIIAAERACWSLFKRKMQTLQFPTEKDPEGSHNYNLLRLRTFTIAHTMLLIVFVWVFCIILWF